MRRDGVGFVPWILVIPAVLGLALLVLPLAGLVARADWTAIWSDLASPEALGAVGLSLLTALIATIVCVILGVPLALLIARRGPRMSAVLRVLVAIPLVLPPMVGGVALLSLLDADSLAGGFLLRWGRADPLHDGGGHRRARASWRCPSSCSRSRRRCAHPARSSSARPRRWARGGGGSCGR